MAKWLEKTLLEASARVRSRPLWARSDRAQQEIARLLERPPTCPEPEPAGVPNLGAATTQETA